MVKHSAKSQQRQQFKYGGSRCYVSCFLRYFFLKDLFKTMNTQAMERMNKNSDKTHSSPLDFSQVMILWFIFIYFTLIPFLLVTTYYNVLIT
jgi:predicted permease